MNGVVRHVVCVGVNHGEVNHGWLARYAHGLAVRDYVEERPKRCRGRFVEGRLRTVGPRIYRLQRRTADFPKQPAFEEVALPCHPSRMMTGIAVSRLARGVLVVGMVGGPRDVARDVAPQ